MKIESVAMNVPLNRLVPVLLLQSLLLSSLSSVNGAPPNSLTTTSNIVVRDNIPATLFGVNLVYSCTRGRTMRTGMTQQTATLYIIPRTLFGATLEGR